MPPKCLTKGCEGHAAHPSYYCRECDAARAAKVTATRARVEQRQRYIEHGEEMKRLLMEFSFCRSDFRMRIRAAELVAKVEGRRVSL